MTFINQQIKELQRKGDYIEIIKILDEFINDEKDIEKRLYYQFQLAEAHYNVRNFPFAKKLAEGLILAFTEEKNYNSIGEVENLLGKIFRIYQRYSEALTHYLNAESAFQKCNNTEGLSKVYHNMGNVFIYLERFKESKKFHTKALEIAKSLQNDDLIANSYLNIGSMHYQNGEVDDALKNFENARVMLETLNDTPSLAAVHLNLAETFFLRRNFSQASSRSAKSILHYKEISNVIGQALALRTFARSEKELNNYDNAISAYKEIITLQEPEVNQEIYLELGECYIEIKNITEAIKSYEAILSISDSTPRGKGFALNNLAMIYGEKKDFSKTADYYGQLLVILHSLPTKDEESIAATEGNLGYSLLRSGKIEESLLRLESALKFFKKKKIWEDAIVLVENYLSEFIRTSKYSEAISFLNKYSIPLAETSKDKKRLNIFVYEEALLYHIKGDTEIGLSYWQKYSKKIPFQEYKPNFLNNQELGEEGKKILEQQHLVFLRNILNKK